MSEEENLEEQEIVVETEGDVEEDAPVKQAKSETEEPSGDQELESYSKGVQNRIKKLTEKYRQEERDKAEAVRLSQQLLEENRKLKTRVQSLDSGYLNEYNNRLESQTLAAKQMFKEAHESGDTDKLLEAQELLSKLAVEKQRYEAAKKQADTNAKQQKIRVKQAQPAQQPDGVALQRDELVGPRKAVPS